MWHQSYGRIAANTVADEMKSTARSGGILEGDLQDLSVLVSYPTIPELAADF